jgi:hypothetical protein
MTATRGEPLDEKAARPSISVKGVVTLLGGGV